jgi:nucleoside-diphosphate-sugar epimerase
VIALVERVVGRTVDVRIREEARGDVKRTAADTTRVRRDLGWEPRTPLEEGLKAQWEWALDKVRAR